jgi:hypothetical protein
MKKLPMRILILVIIISSLLGVKSLYKTSSYDLKIDYLEEIAKESHSVYDLEGHENVEKYLISTLENFGLEPKIYSYKKKVKLENIYAKIDGNSNSYILLSTHYDAVKGSLGAADAGYGIVTILETIRILKENDINLENGIKILITDGEEEGLLGAKCAINEEEIFEGVNYVINLEARGTSGPAIMFETSLKNDKVIDLYKKSLNPFSYSITSKIYKYLPNGTDFTEFLKLGLNGINISVGDGILNYHTENDNLENIDKNSLKHYFSQVYPIVKEFVSDKKYSETLDGTYDLIYFMIGDVFVSYSKVDAFILLIISLIFIIYLIKKYEIRNIFLVLKYLLINIMYPLAVIIDSYILSRILAKINNVEFTFTNMLNIKYENIITILFFIFITSVYIYVIKYMTKNFKCIKEYIISILILFFIYSSIFMILLPEGSYLTMVVLLFMSIFLSVTNPYTILFPISVIIIFSIPNIYLFKCALTIGSLFVYSFLFTIYMMSVVSLIIFFTEKILWKNP